MLDSLKKKERKKYGLGVAKVVQSFRNVSTFSPSYGGGGRHFSNPPKATVPDAAMSNGLIELLHKCVGILKKNGESKVCGGGVARDGRGGGREGQG